MAIYITSEGLRALTVSVRANFQKGYSSDNYKLVAPQIASMGTTRSRKTRFPFPIDSAQIRRHVGDRVFNVVKATSQDLDAAPYELSYVVDRDDLADEDQSENAVALLGTTIRRAGRKYRIMPDRLLRDVLSSNAVSVIDGRALFGTHYVDPTDTGSTTNLHQTYPTQH
jgi:phage major head subunit gpT-like protein